MLSTVQADPDEWTAYIKVRSGGTWIHRSITHLCSQNLSASKAKTVKTFLRKPFPLFDAIRDLIDGTCATGRGAFQAGQVSAFDNSDHDSIICDNSPIPTDSPDLINSRIDLILLKASCNMKERLLIVDTALTERQTTMHSDQESQSIVLFGQHVQRQ